MNHEEMHKRFDTKFPSICEDKFIPLDIRDKVKSFIESEIEREMERIVDIAVARATLWKENGFEIDTLIDSLKIIKLEEMFNNNN